MQSDHATIEELSALLDDRLAEPEVGTVRAHLESCEVCRADLERLRSTVSLLRSVPAAAPPRSFRLRQRTEARHQPVLRFPVLRLPSPVAFRALAGVAAALMVVLFVAEAFRPVAFQPAASPDRESGVAAVARAPAPASETSAGQAAAPQERRALAPQAQPAASAGAPALSSTPAPRLDDPLAQTGSRDTSVGNAVTASRAEPTVAAQPWLTPGRIATFILALLAITLLITSFLARRAA